MESDTMKKQTSTRLLVIAALFAALVAVMTGYVLHIPLPTGGYIHLGDMMIYIAASLLPLPYAIGAAAIGGALADIMTGYSMWALPTFLIKGLIVLPFTANKSIFLCKRNIAAIFVAGIFSPVAYGIAAVAIYGEVSAFIPQVLGTGVQSIGNGVAFLALAVALDRANGKERLGFR